MSADYWINAMDGQPFLYMNKEVDPGLIATLTQDLIPWLEANVTKTPERERRLAEDRPSALVHHRVRREGDSPELFEKVRSKAGRRHRLAAQFGALDLSEDPTESQVQGYNILTGTLFSQWLAL